MRRISTGSLLLGLVLVLAGACGDPETAMKSGDGASEGAAVTSPGAQVGEEEGLPVRVNGRTPAGGGKAICPGAEPPCWTMDGPGVDDLPPGTPLAVEGRLVGDRLRLDRAPTTLSSEPDLPNPCGDEAGAVPGGEIGADEAMEDIGRYAESIPDQFAGVWLVHPGPVVVVAVTGDAARHRAALARQGGVRGLCVTDAGFHRTERALQQAQHEVADRFHEWARMGWHASGAGTDVVANIVSVGVAAADPRLRWEVEERWHGAVRLDAAIEVLEGTVDDLPRPPPGDIAIATRARGGNHLSALGTFTLRYDEAKGCVYLESADDERMKPIWPYGSRALRGPVRVVDAEGMVIATVDQQVSIGGGIGIDTTADDPLACGATRVWVT
jgi:hypothetical protein